MTFPLKTNEMIEFIHYAGPIVVGGVIGYGTNLVAIKMLFRPRDPHFLFGHKLPFTPGMIPKNKARLAAGIASMVSNKLMSVEVMSDALLSDSMIEKVRQKVHGVIASYKTDDRTSREVLSSLLGEDVVRRGEQETLDAIDAKVAEKMTDPAMATTITQKIMEALTERLSSNPLLSIGASIFSGPIESMVSDVVSKMLREKGVQVVSQMIHSEGDKILSKPVSQLLKDRERILRSLEDGVVEAYKRFLPQKLPDLLQTIDISKIVEQRIMGMDTKEMERMILDVCDKELKAITWFGALLGAIMGWVNIFF